MATLAGSTIASTYTYLLKMDGTSGVTSSLVKVQDGDATDTSLSVSTTDIAVDATDKIYLDAGGDTYIVESGADVLDFYVGAANMLKLTESSTDTVLITGNLTVGADTSGHDVRVYSATTNEGLIYDTSEDELGLLLTTKLKFHDIGGGEEIYASANGHLEVNAGTTLDITAPTVDINAATAVTIDSPAVTIASSGADDNLVLTSTDADAGDPAPDLVLYRNSASPADGDDTGRIEFRSRNDNSQDFISSTIQTFSPTVTDGSENGSYGLYSMVGGTLRSKMWTDQTETVFNASYQNIDFRVGGDSVTHTLFVDAAGDRIYIGTDTNTSVTGINPTLQISGTAYDTSSFGVNRYSADATPGYIVFGKSRGTSVGSFTSIADDDNCGSLLWCAADGTDMVSNVARIDGAIDATPGENDTPGRLTFHTTADGSNGVTERMRIASTGKSSFTAIAATDYVAKFHNDGNNSNRYGIEIHCGTDDASGTNYPVTFFDGDGGGQANITFSSGTVTYGAFTANHDAELPEADNDDGYPYGTLVETSELFYKGMRDGTPFERGIRYQVQKASSAYSKSVLGAYAGKYDLIPAIDAVDEVLYEDGSVKIKAVEARDAENENLHQIYVLGDGHILCNGEKGNIVVGDGICTSSSEGEGMKADKMAMIIGIAQEDVSFSGDESKLVAVQYGLQQFTPWTD